ncbi:MAG: hypothetical protein U0984_07615 [Prosthecobacter sp.]|nr:hypothetical protein [Prosthecobacter sp.]
MHPAIQRLNEIMGIKPAPKGPRRRPRGPTLFPGSSLFAAEQGLNDSHVYRVLKGERQSKRVVQGFAAWLKQHGKPWPKAAAVKPSRVA